MVEIRLPTEHVAALQKSQRELNDYLYEINKAEKCGIDCQIERQLHQEASEKITQLLTHYGNLKTP